MDRIIQPYPGQHGSPPAHARPVGGHPIALHAPAAKSPADFARAVRRRVWIVLLVALAVAVPGSLYVIRQPNTYSVAAQIEINPPRFDPAIAMFIVNRGVAEIDRDTFDKYVPGKVAQLTSKAMAERVVNEPVLAAKLGSGGDPAAELKGGLSVQKLPGTNIFDVTLSGRDPERITLLLEGALRQLGEDAKSESRNTIDAHISHVSKNLKDLEDNEVDGLRAIENRLAQLLESEPIIGPDGKNLLEERYTLFNSILLQKRFHFDDLQHQERIARLYPNLKGPGAGSPYQSSIDSLIDKKERIEYELGELRRMTVNFHSDPATRRYLERLKDVDAKLDQLQKRPLLVAPDLSKMSLDHAREEIHKVEESIKESLEGMQKKMPVYQKYLGLVRDRDEKVKAIAGMKAKLDDYEMLAKTQNDPIKPLMRPVEPTAPSGPKRNLQLVLVIVGGIGLGIALVCGLEWIDHRVRVPEQLTAGLSLPLFGVVPRIRRIAGAHRGGHLWIPGAPTSSAADAYRNLRASLIGLQGPKGGPAVTLLITSAKAGEGKSTTALNLAATCARAGERTLLMDGDLRRPSLRDVFDDDGHDVGLVDCLRGELPWQRAVVRTDIPNLDFLPTGDPSGTPIEILGSLELRQLVAAVSGHYDRVIIDGPAVLGLADCRMLGLLVDASLLVVRSGAHELRPLQRAKVMLEQSRVPIAGVVFNGLSEDLENWSSYGPDDVYPSTIARTPKRLEARPVDEPAETATTAS